MSGYIMKAFTAGSRNKAILNMPTDVDELHASLADAFGMHMHSLKLKSKQQGSGIFVHLSTQGDLDAIVSEMYDEGQHCLDLQVEGELVSRRLDALAFFLSAFATLSQFGYLLSLGYVESEPH